MTGEENSSCPPNTSTPNPAVHLSPPVYVYVYFTVFNVIIFCVGVVGNVLVLLVILRMRAMRTRVNYFLASLSMADLLALSVCQPSGMLVFYTRDKWILGYFMCKLVPFLEHWTLQASVLTLLLIGLDRYVTICHPQIANCMTRKVWLLLPIWIVSALFATPFVFLTNQKTGEYYDGTSVQVCHTEVASVLSRVFVTAMFALMFVLPVFLLSFLYVSVISRLRQLSRHTEEQTLGTSQTYNDCYVMHVTTARCRRQVARMMVAIVVLFFLSFLPFKILTLWLTFSSSDNLEGLGFETYLNLLSVARLVTYINCAGNPVIYAWMSPRFRRAFKVSLPRCRHKSPKRGSFIQRPPANPPISLHDQNT